MSDVYHCSPTNSTTFTTCCHVAIIEERKCPRCDQFVYPFDGDEEDYTGHEIETMRFRRAHRSNRRY